MVSPLTFWLRFWKLEQPWPPLYYPHLLRSRRSPSGRWRRPYLLFLRRLACHPLLQDHFGAHGINLGPNKEPLQPFCDAPRSSNVNHKAQEEQNNVGMGWDVYSWSRSWDDVELAPHHPRQGIFQGEPLWQVTTAFGALRWEEVYRQTLTGKESPGESSSIVEPRVGRASNAAASSENLPYAACRFVISRNFLNKFHKCFLGTWWVNKKVIYVQYKYCS